MSEIAKIELGGKVYEFPVVEGTEQEKAIDITKLRQETGYITIDSGYKNTGATLSAITFLDGEEGIHGGYPATTPAGRVCGSRGAVWSARRPVKPEVAGSNPVGTAPPARAAIEVG